eukprot:1236514-Rhodomonas_salina.2
MPNLAPSSRGGESMDGVRSSKSSHGGRVHKEVVLGHGSAQSQASSNIMYKSVAGYNSMQIPEEDRALLNAL